LSATPVASASAGGCADARSAKTLFLAEEFRLIRTKNLRGKTSLRDHALPQETVRLM
jgi:hypothetical protein